MQIKRNSTPRKKVKNKKHPTTIKLQPFNIKRLKLLRRVQQN